MKKPKLKNSPPSTKAIFDALFDKMMMVATSNGQLIEKNKNLREQVEKLTKENAGLQKPSHLEFGKIQPVSTLQVKGFWSDEDKREVFGEKAE